MLASFYSPELHHRLELDPELNKILVLGVDPGMMATNITMRTSNWLTRLIFSFAARISSLISPNGMLRLPQKWAADVLAAVIGNTSPIYEYPKSLYFNGNQPKDISSEAKDIEKRATVWKASVQYAKLREGETCLVHWQ